jgi:hypothetical protein
MAQLLNAPELNLSGSAAPDPAGEAASHAYAAGLQFATALRDQALKGQQQQQLKQHQDQQAQQASDIAYAKEQQGYNQIGATLAPQYNAAVPQTGSVAPTPAGFGGGEAPPQLSNPGNSLKRDPSGLQLDPSQQADDPNHIQIDSRGIARHVPSLEEREKAKVKPPVPLDDTNSFVPSGDLADRLTKAGVKPGTRLPLADALKQQAPGAEHYITGTDKDGNAAQFTVGPDHKAVPIEFSDGYSGAKPESDKPAKYTYNHFTDDSGKVSVTRIGGDEEAPQIWKGGKWTPMGDTETVGAKHKDPDVASALVNEHIQERKDAKEQAGRDSAQKVLDGYQVKEQSQHALRSAYGEALSTQPDADGKNKGQTWVIDPVTHKEEELTPARRAAYQNEYQRATKLAGAYHDAQQKIIVRQGGDPDPAQQQQTAPAGQQTTAPPAAPPAAAATKPGSKGKLTDKTIVRKYLDANHGDSKKAQAAAQADGWVF